MRPGIAGGSGARFFLSRLALAAIVVIGGLIILPGTIHARDYGFPEVEIHARITDEGALEVTEYRSVEFDGQFSGMYMWINQTGGTRIEEPSIAEGDAEYTRNPQTSPGPPGTYFVRDDGESMYLDWSFDARDESRTFTISYRVANAVRVHDDVAELYHQFVGDQWEKPVGRVTVLLQLPDGSEVDDLRAWGHGPLHGEVTITDGSSVQWDVAPLPAETYLEGRVTFPPTLVPEATFTTGEEALPSILEEEERWASQANRARFMSRIDWVLGPLLLVMGPIMAIFFWWKYGKEYRSDFDGDYYRELPGDYSPAELGVLWRFGTPTVDDFTATIMDLARRGWIRLEEYTREERGFLRTKSRPDFRAIRLEPEEGEPLLPHETAAMGFLFDKASTDGVQIAFADLEEYTKKNRSSSSSFWSGWVAQVSARGDVLNFFDTDTRRAQVIELVTGILVALAGVGILVLGYPATGVGALVGGSVLALAAIVLRRRSKTGVEDFTRWRAFRKFLRDFSEMDRHTVPSLVIWEHYLVYAVTLGVAREVLRQLEVVFPNLEADGHRFGAGWLYVSTARGTSAGLSGLSSGITSLTEGMQQSMKQAMAPASSGSGGGGGFSGGGGGGTGGGGGGAR